MISSIAWVPAGVADARPKKYELSPAEQELILLMEQQGGINDSRKKTKAEKAVSVIASSHSAAPNSLPADLRMDEYSDDDDDEAEMGVGRLLLASDAEDSESDEDADSQDADDAAPRNDDPSNNVSESDDDSDDDLNDVPDTREYMALDVQGLEAMGLSQVGGRYTDMQMDELGNQEDDDDESDIADVALSPTDAILVVGKAEDDFASLEVHVYDRSTGNLYVHHDIPLPAFPLCLAHGQVSSQGKTGNYCAVGTFHPGIEIWNLDVLNALEPSCVLGGEDTTAADDLMQAQAMRGSGGAKPKVRGSGGLRPGSHTDAVMALSWNPIHQQVIASGSADMTVKLWDVSKAGSGDQEGCNAATFSHHNNKVQSVAWHPVEGTLLATGSYDRTVALLDARGTGKDVKIVKLPADCEAIAWDIHNPECLTVASEDGTLACYDVRQFETSKPLWSFVANQFGVSDISYNRLVPGFLAISSPDKTVTLWDAGLPGTLSMKEPPKLCGSKDMCSGKLYTVQFYPSDPWLLGTGGSGNQLALWDFSNESEIQRRFAGRVASKSGEQAQVVEAADAKPIEAELESMMAKRETSPAAEAGNGMNKRNKAKGKSPNKPRKGR
ncbi:hypothetical protein MPSEU_000381300 [Mayamaea pseudoterrestris]|nr:hypothetical protein MPSEU_000381300 [Mayamaea pseudoterrestris]